MFKNKFSGKLAVFCSDERFIKATQSFLNKSLDIKQCDLMVVPGGPVFIINKEKNLLDRLKLLVNAHRITDIIIFTHFDCGYYKNCFKGLDSSLLLEKQVTDIRKCQLQLKRMFPKKTIKSYCASINKKKIIFESIK